MLLPRRDFTHFTKRDIRQQGNANRSMGNAVTLIARQQLKDERIRRCWSQQKVADHVGTTVINISRWERGDTCPNSYFRQQLSQLFGKSEFELELAPRKPRKTTCSPPLEKPLHANLPRIWNIPYQQNSFFVDSGNMLLRLDKILRQQEPSSLPLPVVALNGLPGAGKTQLAVEYAYRYCDRYEAVIWIRGDSYEHLVLDLARLAVLLNIPIPGNSGDTEVIEEVKHWLSKQDNCLVILDNVETFSLISLILPTIFRGRVLLTTRAQATGVFAHCITLMPMEREEGIGFILRRAKLIPQSTQLADIPQWLSIEAMKLLHLLGGLPLALDQAGAYIEESSCSLSNYIDLYQKKGVALLAHRGDIVANHATSLTTTLAEAIEKVEQTNNIAADLLRLCAYLHLESIPEALIVSRASELGPHLSCIAADLFHLDTAVKDLRKQSLLSRDSVAKTLSTHCLVQAIVKAKMDEATQLLWENRASSALKTFQQASQMYSESFCATQAPLDSENLYASPPC
jgi:transcriptional regulator with XRE-family HTH domain